LLNDLLKIVIFIDSLIDILNLCKKNKITLVLE